MGWISVGMRPKAPAGALSVVYGDFFPWGWGIGHWIRQKFAILGQFFLYLFFNSYSLSSISSVYSYY